MILLDYVLVPGPALPDRVGRDELDRPERSRSGSGWSRFVVLNTVVNYLGIEFTARVNKIMLIAELIVLAIFLVIGVVALASGEGRGFDFSPLYNATRSRWSWSSARSPSRC